MLVDAAWAADETVVFLALSGSQRLAVLHFVGSAPSLLAHLLPLDLPGVPLGTCITSIAFDSNTEKLAVAGMTASADDAPSAWLFAVQTSPVYLAKLLGAVTSPAASARADAAVGVAFRPAAIARAEERVAASALAIAWPGGTVSLAAC